MRAPSCELWRSLAKFGELWRTRNVIFTRTSLTFTRVPAKVPYIHQSSGEGAFCMTVAFRMCPNFCGNYGSGHLRSLYQGPLNGGVSNGGVSRSGLVLPFLSFLGLSRVFWAFPDLLGDGPGIFPIRPFPLSRPIESTYEEQSRKGPRHNLDLSRKKRETPGFGNPPV